MITSRFKNFLFQEFAYLLANISFYIGMIIASTFASHNFGTGDGNLGIVFAIMILLGQVCVGLVIPIFFSFIKKIENKNVQIGIFVLANLPFLLSFIYINKNRLYDIYIYITGGLLILGSLIYSFLLRKYFSK